MQYRTPKILNSENKEKLLVIVSGIMFSFWVKLTKNILSVVHLFLLCNGVSLFLLKILRSLFPSTCELEQNWLWSSQIFFTAL